MLRKRSVGLLPGLLRPLVNVGATAGTGAVCQLCMKLADYEEIVESNAFSAKVLVRHHGAEELATFHFETREEDHELRERELARALAGHPWFRPETMSRAEETFAADTPDYDTPEATRKVFSGGLILGSDGRPLQ